MLLKRFVNHQTYSRQFRIYSLCKDDICLKYWLLAYAPLILYCLMHFLRILIRASLLKEYKTIPRSRAVKV